MTANAFGHNSIWYQKYDNPTFNSRASAKDAQRENFFAETYIEGERWNE